MANDLRSNKTQRNIVSCVLNFDFFIDAYRLFKQLREAIKAA